MRLAPTEHALTQRWPHIVNVVAKSIDSTSVELLGQSKARALARCRWALMLGLSRRAGWTSTRIARAVGRSDHTTVLHGLAQGRKREVEDPEFAQLVRRVEALI